MIGYVCKYTPVEILECFGEKLYRIEPSVKGFDHADTLMHPNMCTYSKAVLETVLDSELDGLILVNCCDSIKRLYDVLKPLNKFAFLYLLDLPRKTGLESALLFKDELTSFISAYETFSGKSFQITKLKDSCRLDIHKDEDSSAASSLKIAVSGARCRKSVMDLIKNSGAEIAEDFTCTGITKSFSHSSEDTDILCWYAQNILKQFPCMRMTDISERQHTYNNLKDIDGILYHTVKFCDNYSFDYAGLRKSTAIPILKIETDYTEQCEGQIKTRVEAFLEALKVKKVPGKYNTLESCISKPKTKQRFITAGIDSGSTSTNVVIINDKKEMLSFSIIKTGAKSVDSAEKAFLQAVQKAGLNKSDIDFIVSTGYGRVSIPFANLNVTEITCHGKGAYYVNNDIRTIIDIGGQDSKVIRLNEKGEVTDFAMNDKCAAGTGRFLEMMSRTLEISLDEMSRSYEGWKEQLAITSICTVFAESEVVSLIAQNKDKADIIHGLNNSISGKVVSMLDRIGRKSSYMMSGGVAKNAGVVESIEERLGEKLFIYDEPEIIGALGAALIALENLGN